MQITDHNHSTAAIRVSTSAPPVAEECRVVEERPVTISVENVGDYTLMCTPSDAMALAVGFMFTEGLISKLDDIYLLHRCEDDANTMRIRLADSCLRDAGQGRNLIIASSCGICGLERIEEVLAGLPVCGRTLRVSLATILDVHERMKSRQTLYRETGGAHAAAIFTADGEIVGFAEDIGRHNALDKAIGKRLLTPPSSPPVRGGEGGVAGCGLAFSGRASFEIVVKAARAGIELIAAVSTTSSLALEAAQRCGITLCGFVRGDRATIYTGESRIRASD